jgi:uncharacterized protein YbbC (DUF1343 family)
MHLALALLMVVLTAGQPARLPVRLAARPPIRLGLEVLVTDSFHLIRGKRLGLVANQATVDRQGVHAIERLRLAGATLIALMSPEHGFRGAAEPGEEVASTVDSATGLPIYSLYGKSLAPSPEVVAGLDVVLVDLPDVGARYFTYLSTTMEVMKAMAVAGKPVLVLDRPNPIGGRVQGAPLDSAFRTFVGRLAAPMRHGLTLGEQALLANSDFRIGARLTVIPVDGWLRGEDGYETKLGFVQPSPNLKDLESLFHYPGTCLFEGTALSVGRGTDAPFHQVGAPWLDTAAVLRIMRRAALPGATFEGVSFTPDRPGDGKWPETRVAGIRLRLTNHRRYDPILTALTLLSAIYRVHGDSIGFIPAHFDRLAGSSALRTDLLARKPPTAIIASWEPSIRRYLIRRKPFLLYR